MGLLETSKQQQMMQVASDLEFNEAMIAEREQGIQEVEKAVREVNEIFKDLSLIVSQQGEQVRPSSPRCLLLLHDQHQFRLRR